MNFPTPISVCVVLLLGLSLPAIGAGPKTPEAAFESLFSDDDLVYPLAEEKLSNYHVQSSQLQEGELHDQIMRGLNDTRTRVRFTTCVFLSTKMFPRNVPSPEPETKSSDDLLNKVTNLSDNDPESKVRSMATLVLMKQDSARYFPRLVSLLYIPDTLTYVESYLHKTRVKNLEEDELRQFVVHAEHSQAKVRRFVADLIVQKANYVPSYFILAIGSVAQARREYVNYMDSLLESVPLPRNRNVLKMAMPRLLASDNKRVRVLAQKFSDRLEREPVDDSTPAQDETDDSFDSSLACGTRIKKRANARLGMNIPFGAKANAGSR